MYQLIEVLDSCFEEFFFVLGNQAFVFFWFVWFVEDVVLLVFEIVAAKTVFAVPDICAPMAIRDPVGPVDVAAFVQISAETTVVTLF